MSRRTVGQLLEQYLSARERLERGQASGEGNEGLRRRTENLRDRLLVNYSPLVKYVVGKVSACATHPTRQEELMPLGVLGLLNVIETYDSGREAKFETYAISKVGWPSSASLEKRIGCRAGCGPGCRRSSARGTSSRRG